MGLIDFIQPHEDQIVEESEAFAKTCLPAAAHMDRRMLRNHVRGLLKFIVQDMATPQTEKERSEKSRGLSPKPEDPDDSTAAVHSDLRFIEGFDAKQLLAEFRALRASVLKLWMADWVNSSTGWTLPQDLISDFMRFNESIDQMIAESFSRFDENLRREEREEPRIH